ncbi:MULTISPECIES: HNH endonuclease [unclassified Moorena]|uniref:HNH endonuclease n=1 Tax=unclassified Moorena TaxID=2683338 RepID=UPI001400B635|nr:MULTISPECIES: HNH endonuclease [unclassified Moorena]NEO17615.1 HNH endonuclease [Moorena sp. SIO3E8]NEQ04165.1 HNH endonuclease [Moorena sp. SIO3F7]
MRKRLKSVVVRLHYLRFRFRKCAHCGLIFKDGDLLETHHIIPRASGGSNKDGNLELLHLHCHDIKHGKKTNSP